jgi:hypothetical protein
MKATLTLDNKEYKVDINKLIELGLIQNTNDSEDLDSKIEWFEAGDVFRAEFTSVIIMETSHDASFYGKEKRYQIAGLNGLKVYSDFPEPVGFGTILSFLNDGDYKFVKNINEDVDKLINS